MTVENPINPSSHADGSPPYCGNSSLEKLLTRSQAMEVLGVGAFALDRLVERGELPVVRLNRRVVRIRESALRELIERKETRTSAPTNL